MTAVKSAPQSNNFWSQTLLGEKRLLYDILHDIHKVVHASCDNKMVELQRTLSFDKEILPRLLKEREKYNGKLTEEEYGITSISTVKFFLRCSVHFNFDLS